MRLKIKDAALYDENKAKEYLEDWLKTCPIEVSLEVENKFSSDMLKYMILVLEKQLDDYQFLQNMGSSQVPSYIRVLLKEAISELKKQFAESS